MNARKWVGVLITSVLLWRETTANATIKRNTLGGNHSYRGLESRTIMMGGMAAGRQAWSLSSSSEFTSWTTEKAKHEWCELLKQFYQCGEPFNYMSLYESFSFKPPKTVRKISCESAGVCEEKWDKQVWNKQVYTTVQVSMWENEYVRENEYIRTQGKNCQGKQLGQPFEKHAWEHN